MSFEKLNVWKRSAALSAEIYRQLSDLKDWGFKDQITRSGLSISSNIAEGVERYSDKECIQFLGYARGSAGEVRSQIYIGVKAGYIPPELGKRWINEVQVIIQMLTKLISARKSKQ